jgi:formylglycine-generating enzyme required for sulfatase activity
MKFNRRSLPFFGAQVLLIVLTNCNPEPTPADFRNNPNTIPIVKPTGPESGTLRVSRGGSWFDRSYRMSATCRKGLTPSSARMHWVGFRCVISAE